MYKKDKNKACKRGNKNEKPMEWKRRAEQGERGRRRACVLEALPCSRLQHKVLQSPDVIKTIPLHVLTILKTTSTQSGANLETLVSSAGPS
jgi:hypothetical protein